MGCTSSSPPPNVNDLVKDGKIQKLQDHLNIHPNDLNKKDFVSYTYIEHLLNLSLLFDSHHHLTYKSLHSMLYYYMLL